MIFYSSIRDIKRRQNINELDYERLLKLLEKNEIFEQKNAELE